MLELTGPTPVLLGAGWHTPALPAHKMGVECHREAKLLRSLATLQVRVYPLTTPLLPPCYPLATPLLPPYYPLTAGGEARAAGAAAQGEDGLWAQPQREPLPLSDEPLDGLARLHGWTRQQLYEHALHGR